MCVKCGVSVISRPNSQCNNIAALLVEKHFILICLFINNCYGLYDDP